MRRAVVAVDAVHGTHLELRRIILEVFGAEFGDGSVGFSDTKPGDNLAFGVCSDVFDFIGDIHVPVDAADGTVLWIASSDAEQHADAIVGVIVIGEKVVVSSFEITGEFLGPMTLLAGFLGGA